MPNFSGKLVVALATTMALGLGGARAAHAETIKVLLPTFGADAAAKQITDAFTKATGIDVDFQTIPWDNIRPQIVTSMVAGTAPADVSELDWSWVGQFGAAKWFTPLNGQVPEALVKDMPTASVFTFDGQLLGVPYSNDFRVQAVNMADLKKAGITALPTTPDEIIKDGEALKAKKVLEYPISIPLSATEGAATAWYFTTRMFGGELFDKDWKPLFMAADSPGYKAFQWIVDAQKAGLINPAMTGLTDTQDTDAFANGDAAIDIAGHPYDLAQYEDKQRSKIAGQAALGLAGIDPAHLHSVGLPEAMGIPINSQHKEAALKFILWWADHQPEIYTGLAIMPTRVTALQSLAHDGKLSGGEDIARLSAYTQPIFLQGTPSWYSEFSGVVAATVNQAAKGQIGTEAAMKQIADGAQSAMHQ